MVWIALSLWGTAAAQEPLALSFDELLVATVQPLDEPSAARSPIVHAELNRLLAIQNTVVSMADVPYFESHDYDGTTYMESCPRGEYTGCALVIGDRMGSDWVIGGTLTSTPDVFDETKLTYVFDVTFIEVSASREVLSFGVVLDGTHDTQVLQGVSDVFNRIVEGAFDEVDVRGDLDDPEKRARLEEQRELLISSSLEQLEADLGELVRSRSAKGRIEKARITRADLKQYERREDTAPWEQLGMSPKEYRRFRNSDTELRVWRQEANGRFGSLLIRGAGGGGIGPFGQAYDGRVALASDLSGTVETSAYNEVVTGPNAMGELELGFGVAPWVEVGVFAGVRASQFSYLTDEDVVGQLSVQGDPLTSPLSTTYYGARGAFVPMLHSAVRPLLGAGVALWSGKAVPDSDRYPRLEGPSLLLLQLLPGVEAQASRYISLFARVSIEIPVGGTHIFEQQVGGGSLENPPQPVGKAGIGYTLQAGVQVRLGPLWGGADDDVLPMQFEDEDL